MGKKRHTVESIVAKLREADVLIAKEQTMEEVVRQLGISDATYYKWRKEYGGLQIDQAKRYQELEQENQRLRKVVAERTSDGRAIRMLNIIDEYTRECLAIRVDRKITASEVIDTLADIFIRRGTPQFIRSDNGPEFVAQLIRQWLKDLDVQTAFIEPGSPWENGYIESFNGKFRDELLNREIFDTVFEARVITERWRNHYNRIRPHSSLGYLPPAPEIFIPYQVTNA